MKSTNHECLCCGKEYYYCYRCDGGKIVNSWKNNFDSENCRKIFNTCADYMNEAMSADEAKKVLSTADLSMKNGFVAPIRDAIDRIFKNAKAPIKEA